MKKLLTLLSVVMIVFSLAACETKNSTTDASQNLSSQDMLTSEEENGEIDIDLTSLSSTIVFAKVYNMMVSPENYIGKTVKMKGEFAVYENQAADKLYFAVIIADATACCSQGLEFILSEEHNYPDDYPEVGTEITVTGEFQTYQENDYVYNHLINAEME